ELMADYRIVIVSDGEEIPFSDSGDDGPDRFVKEDDRWRLADCEGFGAQEEEFEPPEAEPITPEAPPTPNEARLEASAAEADDDPALPGEYVDLIGLYGGPYPDSASHVDQGLRYDEQGLPPAGGPHWSGPCGDDPVEAPAFCGPAPWGIYRSPWEAATLVHNMEHGGVIVWYNTSNQAVIDELEELVSTRLESGALLVLAPYFDMEAESIALTAWSRRDILSVSDYASDRVAEFIDAHERRFNPEDF
ncbi:MAG: DUF3105 domain-containing protein, partial [Dehalococcoidia bacterium]|nr:DUF3105 domain-containing protein [Dehalococcoidia bacterium]